MRYSGFLKIALGLTLILSTGVGHAGEIALGVEGTYPDIDCRAGVIHIIYVAFSGGTHYMYSRDGGATWAGPFGCPAANDASMSIGRPAVAGDLSGNAHITWSNGRNSTFHVAWTGTEFGPKETAMSSKLAIEPDIAVDKNNVVHIAAYVSDPAWFIGHTKNPGGSWEGITAVTTKHGDADYGAPTLIGDDVGSVHAGWFKYGSGTIAWYGRYDVTANIWTDTVTLPPSHEAGDVLLGVSPDGYPSAAWVEYRNYYGWYVLGIFYDWKDANGWHQGDKVSPGEALDEGDVYTTAGCATDSKGRNYISWQSSNKLRYAIHDPKTNEWLIPYGDVTSQSRQYWYSSGAMGDKGYWVYEDDRGLMVSWGNPEDPPGPVQGDINNDGACNGADLIELSRAFGSSAGGDRWNPDADLDGNGTIDGNDLSILGGNFGRG